MTTNTLTEGRSTAIKLKKMKGPTKAAITFLCLGEQAGS